MPASGIPADEASEHLALLRKLHKRMVEVEDSDGENEIMELIDIFKASTLDELTNPEKKEARNKLPAPILTGLFEVSEAPDYPEDFNDKVQAETEGCALHHVRLDKGPELPLGFSLVDGGDDGVVVKEVFPGTTAALEGNLEPGDRVVAVGSKVLDKGPNAHREAVALLQGSAGVADLWVARRPTPLLSDSPLAGESFWRHLEAVNLERRNGADGGLGFTICRGSQPQEVVVESIAAGGAAHEDGRLEVGDRILEVNKHNVTKMAFGEVDDLLKKKDTAEVQVKIARMVAGQDPMAELMRIDDSEFSEIIEVDLEKTKKGLGLTIAAYVGAGDVQGIFVKSIVPGTSAAEHNVQPLDQILEVDGTSIVGKTNAQSLKLLKATGEKTTLKLKRRLYRDPVAREPTDDELRAKWQPRTMPWEKVMVVKVEKGDSGALGLGIEDRGQGDQSQRNHVICLIDPAGPVGRSGLLQDGDRLLETGGSDLTACDHEDAVGYLKKATQSFKLVVARPMKEAIGSEVATVTATAASRPEPLSASMVVSSKTGKPPVQAWEEPREVTLHKDDSGRLGFSILDYDHPDNDNEIIILIRSVVPKSVAYGVLRENQKLIHVNGVKVEGMTLEEALPLLIAQPQGKVRIGIADPVESQSESSSTVETTESQTITIPTKYGELPLGVDVDVEVGRAGVVVKALLRSGVVFKDGRLAVGDRLLAVNHVKLEQRSPPLARSALLNASLSDERMLITFVPGPRHGVASDVSSSGEGAATKALSPASVKSSGSSPRLPRLSVYSDPITVEVPRIKGSGGLGISIVGGNTMIEDEDGTMTRIKGIFIKHVLPDTPAGKCQLKSGDRLLKVDDVDLENSSHQEAVQAIRAAGNPVTLVIQTLPATMRESRKERLQLEVAAKQRYDGKFAGYELLVVELVKGDQGLGLGLGTADGNIFVGDIREGSNAAGTLAINDILVEVDGTETAHLSHADVSEFLRLAPSRMLAVIARKVKPVTPSASPAINRAPVSKLKLTSDELREVTLVKPATGSLGMSISKHRSDERILFIKSITAGSVASLNPRIRRGDHVLEINGQSTRDLDYKQAITLLKEAEREVTIVLGTLPPSLFASPPVSPTPSSPSHSTGGDVETITLVKPPNAGLGISVVQRAHPTIEGKSSIFVADVVMDGVAYKDGRLKAGSRIMSVNGIDTSEAIQAQAVAAMKAATGNVVLIVQSPATSGTASPAKIAERASEKPPRLGALRSLTLDQTRRDGAGSMDVDESADEPRRVVIHREPGQSLGISIAGGVGSMAGDVPIFIAGVQPEGVAAATKNVQVGDRVLEVNSENVLGMSRGQVVNLLRAADTEVIMLLVRDSGITTLNPAKTTENIAKTERRESEFRTVNLQKSDTGYGFSIVGGRDEMGTDFPIYIKEVVAGTVADKCGELHRGDQLVSINALNLENMSCREASLRIVESAGDYLTLTLLS